MKSCLVTRSRKKNWLGYCIQQTQGKVMMKIQEGLINGKRNRGRRRDGYTDAISRSEATSRAYESMESTVCIVRFVIGQKHI